MDKRQQNKVTTHGAAGKGRGKYPTGGAKAPAQNVSTGNCKKYAFPSTGGMRKD